MDRKESSALRPTHGEKNSTMRSALPWKLRPQLCHLDRSVPGFPATRHRTRPRVQPCFKERRMMFANATNFYRKSGAAQWRDLCVDALSWKCFSTERTRTSCHAAHDATTCAAFIKESRMKFASATKFNRKSGVAQWRDLRFLFPVITQTPKPGVSASTSGNRPYPSVRFWG